MVFSQFLRTKLKSFKFAKCLLSFDAFFFMSKNLVCKTEIKIKKDPIAQSLFSSQNENKQLRKNEKINAKPSKAEMSKNMPNLFSDF